MGSRRLTQWLEKISPPTGQRTPARRLPLPHRINVEADVLCYGFDQVPNVVKLSDGFFSDFLNIADALASDLPKLVRKYATRWGVLELCERHGLPCTHPSWVHAQHPAEAPAEYFGYCPPRQHRDGFSEPLSEWRYWSRQALALVKVAGSARRGEFGPEEEFKFLLPIPPREAREIQTDLEDSTKVRMTKARIAAILGDAWPQTAEEQWKIVAQTVNFWLTLGRAQPICTIENAEPAVVIAPGVERGWLFTMLSVQLLVAVTGAKVLECCTNCRSFYLPKKLASTGARRFCPKCGIRAARRLAQADYRKKRQIG